MACVPDAQLSAAAKLQHQHHHVLSLCTDYLHDCKSLAKLSTASKQARQDVQRHVQQQLASLLATAVAHAQQCRPRYPWHIGCGFTHPSVLF